MSNMANGCCFQVDGPWFKKGSCRRDLVRKDEILKDVCQKQKNEVAGKVCRVAEARKNTEGQNHSEI